MAPASPPGSTTRARWRWNPRPATSSWRTRATTGGTPPPGVVPPLAGTPGQPGRAAGTGAAARFTTPFGLAVAPATGDAFVAAAFNDPTRMIPPAGVVTTLAGTAGQSGSA